MDLTWFCFENELVLQNDTMRRTWWILWFYCIWPVKRTCILYFTHMWSRCIHSWGIESCLFGLDLFVSIIFEVVNERRTLSKIVFKTKYLENLLWIVWYDYMKISEWLICVENDIYLSMKYFLLYLDCEK